jgi:hypothetical protein
MQKRKTRFSKPGPYGRDKRENYYDSEEFPWVTDVKFHRGTHPCCFCASTEGTYEDTTVPFHPDRIPGCASTKLKSIPEYLTWCAQDDICVASAAQYYGYPMHGYPMPEVRT